MSRASDNAINTDAEGRRAFVAPLLVAGYGRPYAAQGAVHREAPPVNAMQPFETEEP